jgi:CRISPR-associated protein (TIGR02710 family)
MTQILICTVGGSHQPIVTSINELLPDFVLFVCTDKDPATGRPGSVSEIIGKGNIIKAKRDDEKPTLPNIPSQTDLQPDAISDISQDDRDFNAFNLADKRLFQYVLTPSDDLDCIYHQCKCAIDTLKHRFPHAIIHADYTGGTKSMSAGLVMAALEHANIALQLVTGSRADLVKVQDGSQFTASANSEQIRFQRLIAPYQQAWHRYAYSEAEAGLRQIKAPNDGQLRGEYTRFRDLSRTFAEWDNFSHSQALNTLHPFAPRLPDSLKPYLAVIMRLTDNNEQKRDAARLYDLYLNAQRRAAQGRYDDAVARIYRLIEWAAQWLLKYNAHIDTADVQQDAVPDDWTIFPNRDGKIQVGLITAWQLVKHQLPQSPAAQFIQQEENRLLNQTKIRNQSILAHGYTPISQVQWNEMQDFLVTRFIPMLLQETKSVGIRELPPQLPDRYLA